MGNLWSPIPVPPADAVARDFGPLRLWCRTYHGDLWLGRQHIPENTPRPETPPDDLDWLRWPLEESLCELRFTPALPDRPVVIQMEAPFVLTPDARARIFIRCPVWVRVAAANADREVELTEVPAAVLSNTWFGVFTEGDLCYWLSSSGRRRYTLDENRLYQAVCPLAINNKAREPLNVEKLCVRVPGHSLYRDGDQLWADESRIEYRGARRISQVRASGTPPPEAPQAALVAGPRDPEKSDLVARTFLSLKNLPGLGFLPG